MKKDEAKERYVADFLALPPAERQTEKHADSFARKTRGRYAFGATGDPAEQIRDWLLQLVGQAI